MTEAAGVKIMCRLLDMSGDIINFSNKVHVVSVLEIKEI